MNEFKSIWAPLNERSHMRKATNLYNFIYMKFYLEKANSSVRKQISGCLGEEWGKGIEYRQRLDETFQRELVFVFMCVVVMQLYIMTKIHQTLHLKCMNYIICK